MPENSVLVIGESLVDLIGESSGADDLVYRPRYGGSPFNVAIGAARLGAPVVFATALGSDAFGRQLRAFLESESVEVISSDASERRTCLAVATTVDGNVDYEYFGDTASMLQIPAIDADVVAGAAIVHAGSTAFLAEPVLSSALTAFETAGAFKTMDPNPRPFLIDDREAYVRNILRAASNVDLLKMSVEDAEYLFPGSSLEEISDRLITAGCRVTLITAAAGPTFVGCTDGTDRVEVPPFVAVDPTGAGDSFMASVLRDVWRGLSPDGIAGWVEITRRAIAAASITCSSVGGAASMPSLERLNEVMQPETATSE